MSLYHISIIILSYLAFVIFTIIAILIAFNCRRVNNHNNRIFEPYLTNSYIFINIAGLFLFNRIFYRSKLVFFSKKIIGTYV